MNDLEFLREMFKDSRLHFGIGTIVELGLSLDKSTLRVKVNLLPENREVIATMGWSDVNDVTFPESRDLVLVAFVDGHPDDCFVIKYVSTTEEPIPSFAAQNHSVKYARKGKKLYLGSDTKVGIGRPDVEPASPLVLGDVLKTYLEALESSLSDLIDKLSTTPIAITTAPGNVSAINPAIITLLTAIKVQMTVDKNTYLSTSSSNILSQIAFTERGA